MSNPLLDAATRALSTGRHAGQIDRVTLEVSVDGRSEQVTISMRDGKLRCIASDGSQQGPHIDAALSFIAGASLDRISQPPTAPTEAQPAELEKAPVDALAVGLEDLVVAVARAGLEEANDSPSVSNGFDEVLAAAPQPVPTGLSRWVGRLRSAIERRDVALAARLLDGASRVSIDLRDDSRTAVAQTRIGAWLGRQRDSAPGLKLFSDRTLIELAREWLDGVEQIERRYLLDLRSGELYREERLRSERGSLGPCPRQLAVGLAEVQPGPSPRKIRLLQYVVQPEVSASTWARIAQFAQRDFRALNDGYRQALVDFPGVAEPFALVAPELLDRDHGLNPLDATGRALPIAHQASTSRGAAFEMLNAADDPLWIAGRLTHANGDVEIAPLSFASHLPLGGAAFERLS